MRIVDLNLLIYATDEESTHHERAKTWLDAAMQATRTVGLPDAVTVGFIRIVTNPRIMRQPLAPRRATTIVEGWLARSNVSVPRPTVRHYGILLELIDATGAGGNLVSDAHLAALAIEHGAELWSFDSDFARFPGVAWHRPGDDRPPRRRTPS